MSPDRPAPAPVAGWDDYDLLATAQENRGLGVDFDLPSDLRFRASVIRLVRRRLKLVPDRGAPSVFFLLPTGPQANADDTYRVPMLNNGVTPIEGHLWFVGPVASRGLGIRLAEWDDVAVFEKVIEELGVGDVPAVLYETRTDPPEARFYPSGLGEIDTYELLRLDASDITLNDILEVVDRQYKRSLKTPDAQHEQGKLWANKRRRYPSSKAESRIEFYLREGLTGAFPSCVVRAEQPQPSGRLDLEIEEPNSDDPSTVTRHAILELKVLRSFRSSGTPVPPADTEKAVADGVRQAAAYRIERESRASALCCFDMRVAFTGEACFSPVRALAKRHRVRLCAWHLFASSAECRAHSVN